MITEAKKRKKKKYADSVSITTGDIEYNIRQFNKRMGTDFPGNDNNNPSTAESDFDNAASAATEAGGISESMKINEATKREIKRYYIRPQNIFCSTKTDILKALADSKDKNCSVYSLKRLEDHDDVHKLTNNDIIYYYDNNVLYDKNHVQVLDYDLYVKHEEERPHLNVDSISNSEFAKNYDDRMTDLSIEESLTESQAQEISREYKILNRMYGEDIEELVYGKDGFMQSRYPEGFKDFAGDIIYNKKYWNEFEDWLKTEKGIDLSAKRAQMESIELNDNPFDQHFDSVNAYGENLSLLNEEKEETCCICGEPIKEHGNNPYPYKEDGRCCDACNYKFVIPARLQKMQDDNEI